MRNKLLKIRFKALLLGVGLLVPTITAVAHAQENSSPKEIDAVWTQSDGIRPEIFYSQNVSGVWSEPVMVTDDYYDNMYPVIDQDSKGKKWLFWTAYDNQLMDIRYTTGQDGEWADSMSLTTGMQRNIAPSVIIDKSDVVRLVWSANSDGAGDIFYATNKDGLWSDPVLVNEPNATADVLPIVELNEDDQPVVTWKGMSDGKMVDLVRSWDGERWSEVTVVTEEQSRKQDDESDSEMIELAEFMPKSGMVFLRVY